MIHSRRVPARDTPIGIDVMSKRVILSAAKDLSARRVRSFAALRMTCDDQSCQVVVLEGRLTLTPMDTLRNLAPCGQSGTSALNS